MEDLVNYLFWNDDKCTIPNHLGGLMVIFMGIAILFGSFRLFLYSLFNKVR